MSTQKGFTLIELLIVILIVGILAAVATPLYLGYVKDAKTAEAKAVVGSLWSAVQGSAIAKCGTATPISDAYAKAGLSSSGTTTPARWNVTSGAGTLTVSCTDGAYTPSGSDVFEVTGSGADVSFIKVKLVYSSAANPPSKLQCDTGNGYTDC
jgi:prepilin-type N-terminal cleavage/methylation domain-containing protein